MEGNNSWHRNQTQMISNFREICPYKIGVHAFIGTGAPWILTPVEVTGRWWLSSSGSVSSCILTWQEFKSLLCQLTHQEVFYQILYTKKVEALFWHKSFHGCGKSVQLSFSPPVGFQYGIEYLLTPCVPGAVGQMIPTLQQGGISCSVTVQWIALGVFFLTECYSWFAIYPEWFISS